MREHKSALRFLVELRERGRHLPPTPPQERPSFLVGQAEEHCIRATIQALVPSSIVLTDR